LHAVDPATAVRRRVGRKAERVCDATGRITIVRQLPKLFHADAVGLRLASFIKSETLHELFRKRAAWSFAEHSHLRAQIDSRLIVGFALPFLIDAFVAGAHAEHAIVVVVEQVSAGKLRKDVDARFFSLLAEP